MTIEDQATRTFADIGLIAAELDVLPDALTELAIALDVDGGDLPTLAQAINTARRNNRDAWRAFDRELASLDPGETPPPPPPPPPPPDEVTDP